MIVNRRKLLTGGIASLLAAPAIVKYASIMPVKAYPHTEIAMGYTISYVDLPEANIFKGDLIEGFRYNIERDAYEFLGRNMHCFTPANAFRVARAMDLDEVKVLS